MQRGGSRGGARGARPPHPTLFFDQNEARRAKKNSFGDRPPLVSGSGWPCPPRYLRVWMTVSPPLSQGLDDRVPPVISGSGWPCPPPYLRVWMTVSPPPLISGSGSTTVQWKEKTRSVCFDQKLRTFPHLFSNVFLTYLTASLTGIYLQTFEFVCPNLLLPVPINQVIVMEISLLVLWLGLIAVKFS